MADTAYRTGDGEESSVNEGLFDDDDDDDDDGFFDPGTPARPKNRGRLLARRLNADAVIQPWQSLRHQGVRKSCMAGCRVFFRRDRPWTFRERALLVTAAVLLVGLIIVIAVLAAGPGHLPATVGTEKTSAQKGQVASY
jgi:hypothetical protein